MSSKDFMVSRYDFFFSKASISSAFASDFCSFSFSKYSLQAPLNSPQSLSENFLGT